MRQSGADIGPTFTPDLYVQYLRDRRDMIAAGQEPTIVPATEFAPKPEG